MGKTVSISQRPVDKMTVGGSKSHLTSELNTDVVKNSGVRGKTVKLNGKK